MLKLIYIIIFSLVVVSGTAQIGGDPFSGGILGSIYGSSTPTETVIGGDAANQDSTFLNFSNPASYSSLTFGQPLFSTSLGTRVSKFSENGINLNFRRTQLDHLSFGLSFGKRFGAAMGFTPYSTKNYEINDFQIAGTDTVFQKYKGQGGVNNVFAGFAFKVLNKSTYKLNIGIQGEYLFGDLTDERFSGPKSSLLFGGYSMSQYKVKDVKSKLGVQFTKTLKNHRFDLGFVYTPSTKLSSYKTDSTYYSPQFSLNPSTGKIIISGNSSKGNLILPSTAAFGLIYHYEPKVDSNFNAKYLYRLSVYTNFETTAWSAIREDFGTATELLKVNDASRLSLGLEFTPHRNVLDNSKTIKYLAKVKYRVGFQNGNFYNNISQNQVKEQSFNFGFGFPIPSQRSISNVNVGFRFGTRGNGVQDQLKEKYWTINFGILLAPGKNDKWFRKYLYD